MVSYDIDKLIIILTGIFFLFLSVNFSPQILGIVYTAFIFFYYMFILDKDVGQYTLSIKNVNVAKMIVIVSVIFVVWITAVIAISNYFGAGANYYSIFKILASNTSPPFISQNKYLSFFITAVAIPIAETLFFFGVILSYLVQALNLNVNSKRDWLILAVAVASFMTIFHLAVQYSTQYALVSTFVFAFISTLMVLKFKNLTYALIFHIIANASIVSGLLFSILGVV